jgi:MFS family permease
MTSLGAGIIWTAQAPVQGHYVANLFGPFLIAVGMGTAFTFIPISIAALAGVEEHDAGLASGLNYTSTELGGALGIAIASSVAASHFKALVHGGDTVRVALTGGFHTALWVSAAIALLGIPLTLLLVRKDEMAAAIAAMAPEPQSESEPQRQLQPEPAV